MRFQISTAIVAVSVFAAAPAAAQTAENYMNCTKSERGIIDDALSRSKRLALTAATAIGPTPVFERWFGKYSPAHGEAVRSNLKAIVGAIRTGEVTARCGQLSRTDCDGDTYAYVQTDRPYLVNLCPSFFEMESMDTLDPEDIAYDNGTRAGTMIHEISHFAVVADTDDICYSRTECSSMARRRADHAIRNADSYQYFSEDVTFYGVEGGLNPAIGFSFADPPVVNK